MIRKLRSMIKEHEKFQQVDEEFRKLRNIIKNIITTQTIEGIEKENSQGKEGVCCGKDQIERSGLEKVFSVRP